MHALCKSDMHRPVGIDLLQSIITAVPNVLYIQDASRRQTPLHVALDSGASLGVIECLLTNDTTQQTVTIIDKNGDTPLLLAARHSDSEDMIKLLLKHDRSKQSLLMESKQRKRVPLWYVTANELRTTNGNELSEELKFMLLQTHQALLGYKLVDQVPSHMSNDSYKAVPTDDNSSLTDENDGGCVLEATIACTHLLGKYTPRLTAIILKNNLYRHERLFKPDKEGNLMLHHACMATAQYFDRNLKLDDTQVDLIQHLVELNAASLSHYNARGELPLHLAIQTGKDRGHINTLLRAHPDSVEQCNARGELPLHLAIKLGYKQIAKTLWKQYPQSAAIVDGSTGLYPFQLVACHNLREAAEIRDCTTQEKLPVGDNVESARTASVDLIYFFLRESPHALKPHTR